MSYSSTATSAYAAASKMVTSLQAVVMLYDGVIQCLAQAKAAIEEGRIEDRFNATQKATKIVLGLQSALDFELGGDVAPMLDQFYSSVFTRLQRVNFENSVEVCDDLMAAFSNVRDSWRQLAQQEAQPGGSSEAQEAALKQAVTVSV